MTYTEVRSPKSEVRSPKSEVRSPKSEVRSPKSEIIMGAVVTLSSDFVRFSVFFLLYERYMLPFLCSIGIL